jgi:hypothetical protein
MRVAAKPNLRNIDFNAPVSGLGAVASAIIGPAVIRNGACTIGAHVAQSFGGSRADF